MKDGKEDVEENGSMIQRTQFHLTNMVDMSMCVANGNRSLVPTDVETADGSSRMNTA